MQSRYKFFDTIYNPILAHTQKGFPTSSLKEMFSYSDDLAYKIPLEHKYRPDLIASKFYRNSKLFWVLVYANEFYNSPEDFDVNVVIRIPRYERIAGLL